MMIAIMTVDFVFGVWNLGILGGDLPELEEYQPTSFSSNETILFGNKKDASV